MASHVIGKDPPVYRFLKKTTHIISIIGPLGSKYHHNRPDLLQGILPPIDFHEIMAVIVPRAFLDLSSIQDGEPLPQEQRVLMLLC